jgi:pimeloyl-ACP methyl ester carboxylesterase
VLCIHGFPTASWDWHAIWGGLTQRHRVIAPDMIGFGYSAKPRDYEYSIRDQATLHEALLDQLGVRSAHVLAHDYGDTVAQELLARAGDSSFAIRSICFLNGGLFPEIHRARAIQKLLDSPVGPLVSRLLTEQSFRRSFSAIFGPDTPPTEGELSDFWSLVAHNDGNRIAHKLIRYMRERRASRERWVGAMQSASIPLRFVNGAADPISGVHMARRYEELIPNPDVVVLDRIGHYPQVEAPQAVLDAFLDFVVR